ncbi:hypothetical protein [Sinisalibacter aestuarii]|uniref:Uncharacterized protein n=1 Tax=Sinisalibacter aestuarii TaxID=2949426 RepID=A0ABQ5LVP7_9RHOB|nr:hypothetical protein [Sinisalibacter aestuarii]GKY88431.1 hypothetical protein STA1M1_23000 [Sinisalibacter aestuarii]
MTASRLFMNVYSWGAMVVSVAGLVWMLISPPPSMHVDRDGVAHFTPMVEHPITGEAVSMNALIRHYRGD